MPERTCIGCRAHGSRSELLRVVARPPFVLVDPSASFPGRGAWLHPSQQCVEQAVKRRAFGRAFRVSTSLDATPVGEYLASLGAASGHGATTDASGSR